MHEPGPFHGAEIAQAETERLADHALDSELVGGRRDDGIIARDRVIAKSVVSGQRDADGVAYRAGDAAQGGVDLRADGNADARQTEDPEHGTAAHVDGFLLGLGRT